MEITLLNTRITFQKNAVVTDKIGNRTNAWTDFYSCYATVSGEGGSEEVAAGIVVEHSDVSFTVRWCKAAAAVTSTGYRITMNGEIYNILAVDHQNYKRKSLKFRCQKERRS